ncbi:alpha-tocopherol transfer protein-like [Hydractinia symbiolongicarpus]|uniref:alpha-tocopherol transfer protein-like n=1 Tax=Hydractinia symbiolongicarpus TaxID=13093 RepID=UPI00254ED2E0|nr:alpha-tocopherol transfer protein-like [Hydractinia symbiolongicarpus]
MSLDVLSPHLVEKARRELNEYPETRLQKIAELREKLKERPDLRFDTTNKDLIRFLRARKFDVGRAFELVVAHYECKRDNGEVFGNFSPSTEKRTFESGWNVTFPERDQEGRKVLAFRPGTWDPSERSLMNNLRANIMAMEVLIQDEETQINGVVFVVDFRNFGMTQAKALNPLVFRKYGSIVFNCYPVRIKGIHILHQPAVFTVIFAIISQFMKEKVKKRVVLHGVEISGLCEYINKDLIPSDYGGTNRETDLRAWVKHVMDSEEELEHIWS